MPQRITQKDLDQIVRVLNRRAGTPETPSDDNGNANVGAYILHQAYGSTGLHQIVSEGFAVRTIVGLTTRRECYNAIAALIDGIEIGRRNPRP